MKAQSLEWVSREGREGSEGRDGWMAVAGALVAALLQGVCNGAEVAVDLAPPAQSNHVASYQIHYGGRSRGTNLSPALFRYEGSNSFPRTNLSPVIGPLDPGVWYLSATATSSNGLMSLYSTNEVAWTNREFAPVLLRIAGPREVLVLQSASGAAGPWKNRATFFSNEIVNLAPAERAMFRALATNLPPLPGGAR